MNRSQLLTQARDEWREHGMILTNTALRLAAEGVDVYALEDNFQTQTEETDNHGQA